MAELPSGLVEVVKLTDRPTLALALQNYIAHCNTVGTVYKISVQGFIDFIAPKISSLGSSGFVPVSGSVLPDSANDVAYTLVEDGVYAQSSGVNVVAGGDINILGWDGTSWSLIQDIELDRNFISDTQSPYMPIAGEIPYNLIDLTVPTMYGGDTNSAYYASFSSVITQQGTKLTEITTRVFSNTTVIIAAVKIELISGVLNVHSLHSYLPIPVVSGISTVPVNDDFELPKGCFIAVGFGDAVAYYYQPDSASRGYRVDGSLTGVATTAVQVAYSFKTSNSAIDTRPLITEGRAVELFQPKSEILEINAIEQVKLKFTPQAKIMLYGTSISSTDYPWYKTAMEDLVGCEAYNGGFSGGTASFLAKNSQIQRIIDYGGHLILTEVGANDIGAEGTVGTFGAIEGEPLVLPTDISQDYNGTFFIQAVDHLIRKIKYQYYNIRERAGLNGSETEEQKQAKIEAVFKPYYAFLTGFRQKRVDENSAFTLYDNQLRKRNAIVEACNRNQVHCIDTFLLLGWEMSLEPYWPNSTDLTNNRGVYTMDGLHPNKFGYDQIARINCGQIGMI